MSNYFFDSSALVKRYIRENGSARIRSLMAPAAAHEIWVALVTGVEVMSALARQRPPLSPQRLTRAQASIRGRLQQRFQTILTDSVLVAQAMTLALRHRLRGYDAIQLAAAIEPRTQSAVKGLPAPVLVSADAELNVAALAEGFTVDDPLSHP